MTKYKLDEKGILTIVGEEKEPIFKFSSALKKISIIVTCFTLICSIASSFVIKKDVLSNIDNLDTELHYEFSNIILLSEYFKNQIFLGETEKVSKRINGLEQNIEIKIELISDNANYLYEKVFSMISDNL